MKIEITNRLDKAAEEIGNDVAETLTNPNSGVAEFKKAAEQLIEFSTAFKEAKEIDRIVDQKISALYDNRGELDNKKVADAYLLGKMMQSVRGGDIFDTSLGQEVKKNIVTEPAFKQRFSVGILDELEQRLTVANKFETFNFQNASNWFIPFSDEDNTRPTILKPGYVPSNPYAQPGTDNVASFAQSTIGGIELIPSLFQRAYKFSADEAETTLVPMVEHLRRKAVRTLAKYQDEAVLRGDNSAPGYSDPAAQNEAPFYGITALAENVAGDALKQFTGANGASVTLSNVVAARKSMGKYGIDPNDLALFLNIDSYNDMVDEQNVRTVDQYGPGATILSGELARVYGIPVFIARALDVNGNTNVSNNTVGALVYRPGFAFGQLKDIVLDTRFEPASRHWTNFLSQRYDFTALTSEVGANLSTNYSMAISFQTGTGLI